MPLRSVRKFRDPLYLDVTEPDGYVEIQLSADTMWVNVDGEATFRCTRIQPNRILIRDERLPSDENRMSVVVPRFWARHIVDSLLRDGRWFEFEPLPNHPDAGDFGDLVRLCVKLAGEGGPNDEHGPR